MTRRSPADADTPLSPLAEEALSWLVRLHSGEATETDWAAYERWKAAAPARAEAAQAAEHLWRSLGQTVQTPAGISRRAMLGLGVVAGAGVLAWGGWAASTPGAFADQRTVIGERRSLTLADGSVLDMDAGTRLDIAFAPAQRRIILHEGQLHVAVSPDAARPFEVLAGDMQVRALGTAFNVRRHGQGGDVLVTEHAVQVSWPGSARAVVVVREGELLAGSAGYPEAADVMALTGWRRGQLVFDDQPLATVIADMARYRRGWVLVRDPALAALRVTGVFETSDPDALLDALAAVLPVRVRHLPFIALIEPA